MDCLTCMDLEHALESKLSKYSEARCAAFYQVSTKLAAQKRVDMERARNDLEEHQLICPSRRTDTPEFRQGSRSVPPSSPARYVVCVYE
jgi:hypothetical protein